MRLAGRKDRLRKRERKTFIVFASANIIQPEIDTVEAAKDIVKAVNVVARAANFTDNNENDIGKPASDIVEASRTADNIANYICKAGWRRQ